MKITKLLLTCTLLALTTSAFAYTPEEQEKICKKPKFTDFNLTEYEKPALVEIEPESELFFKVSVWTDPSTLKMIAKGKPLPYTVESNSSFHKIKAKLPAELNGQFVRINVSAKAILGCHSEDGWLVKVAEKK
ncbi:hypothetical protein JCM14076_03680 [Methylosoma difficile]